MTEVKAPSKPKKKVLSGYCNAVNKKPQCEGTKPVDWKGNPMPVCLDWTGCACKCHAQITEMYKMADLPREPPEQSPEWIEREQSAHLSTAAMLETVARDVLSSRVGPMAPASIEGTLAGQQDAIPATSATVAPPSFATTPTGRRVKGQLEYDVLKVCDDFMHDVYEWEHCTPKMVSEEIGKRYAIEPPSTGAINAVWDRWEKLGFAEQAKKPSRFVGFKVDGSPQTLEMMKVRAKRDRRLSQAESKRGSLRPRGR